MVLAQMLKCIELDERLKAMDQEITVNPQFVQKVNKVLRVEEEGYYCSKHKNLVSFVKQLLTVVKNQ